MSGIDWSDWVIRLPGGGDSAEGTVILLLVVAFLAYALVRGTTSVAEKITPMLWSLVTFFAFIVVVVLIGRASDDQQIDPALEDQVESNCSEELLSRCPPAGDGG